MNVAHEKLTAWRGRLDQIRTAALNIRISPGWPRDRDKIQERIQAIHDLAVTLSFDMEQHGAQRPAHLPAAPTGYETPLHLLSTPANLRLMAIIQDAIEQSRRVDAERGLPGAPEGGPHTAMLEMVLGAVEAECYGADSGS